jgi:cytochrome c-type biogenesis protein CcmH/NrfF
MRLLWWIPLAALIAGAGVFLRSRRRRSDDVSLTSEPVSADWLAQARGRDDGHHW